MTNKYSTNNHSTKYEATASVEKRSQSSLRYILTFGIVVLLTISIFTIFTGNAYAISNHSIHIEWDYDSSSIPVGVELSAYRFYKEGVQVFQFNYPYDYIGDCEFQSENGLYDFTLTAVWDDGSELLNQQHFYSNLGQRR